MQAHEINNVAPQLLSDIDDALKKSVAEVVTRCNALGNIPEEPDFIASLTISFPNDLYTSLKRHFPKNKFSVTGIYCHQKPIVDIGGTKKPELGDLLLVYIYKDQFGNKQLNSLLFQAKRIQKFVTDVPSGDLHQLKLYLEWPTFKYERAGRLNGESRDIHPKSITDGGQYLLIDDHPVFGLSGAPTTFPMACAVPAPKLSLNTMLSIELLEFLKFKSGRTFEQDTSVTKDDWTKMVWDLLEVTKSKASKRKNMGLTSFPRRNTQSSDGLCFFASSLDSIFSDLHSELSSSLNRGDDNQFIDEENIGISVIVIESSVAETERGG